MNTNELRVWAEKHEVEKKTIDCFWEAINSYEEQEDEPFFEADIDKSQLVLNLNGVGLFIDAWNKDSYSQYGFDYVISYLKVIYNEEHLGDYKLFFKLDGEIFDDSFSPL